MRRREPLSSCVLPTGSRGPLGVIPSMQAPPSLREKPQLELYVLTDGHVAWQQSAQTGGEQESEVSICKAKRCDFLLEPEEDVIFGGTVLPF